MMRLLASVLFVALLAPRTLCAQVLETRSIEGVLHVVWGDPQEMASGTVSGGGPLRAIAPFSRLILVRASRSTQSSAAISPPAISSR